MTTPTIQPTSAAAAAQEALASADPFAVLRRYRRATNYLAAAQVYLQSNALLREPLTADHVKPGAAVQSDHRATKQAVLQRLGQLVAKSVDDFGGEAARLFAQSLSQPRVFRRQPRHFSRARAVNLQQPRTRLLRETARRFERLRESPEVFRDGAR